ncbi:Uncharacterised protein [Bordetella ansorpii]|uniref:Uncharacterized protein n=1 Tax=Bordetella ansorpii TaxID=288768 RepID=A0A157SW90_9BORD|nr:hypothetical protein [Bordetella ansorpii]SAI74343.1 Uncharacterised protein [Bordetella ansorpii]
MVACFPGCGSLAESRACGHMGRKPHVQQSAPPEIDDMDAVCGEAFIEAGIPQVSMRGMPD